MIIGVIGFISSGKDTVGNILCAQGWKRDSFARSLKDAVAIIFGWDRTKLEGATKEDREWREVVDPYWTKVLGKTMSPRIALQLMGTEAGRRVFGEGIWTASTIRRIQNDPEHNYVITDVRFNNEIEALRETGAWLIRVHRGPEPKYWSDALMWNMFDKKEGKEMPQILKDTHQSEWDWIGSHDIDYQIDNNGTLQQLESKIVELSRMRKL